MPMESTDDMADVAIYAGPYLTTSSLACCVLDFFSDGVVFGALVSVSSRSAISGVETFDGEFLSVFTMDMYLFVARVKVDGLEKHATFWVADDRLVIPPTELTNAIMVLDPYPIFICSLSILQCG
eukprot:CAMPEP_0184692604 /NCGR_PEP_ID=MMETSP0313-20130426/1015_1 /TAXON_ID=2792 /ORGANISM="Porphyridium aerugineum, Strain SAG 1380-2" /LENGTH=124 /DNA_ID=CAMNT_0027150445 /DNA_START=318 /DNA_END=692 /DNA_ORIENTATION=-